MWSVRARSNPLSGSVLLSVVVITCLVPFAFAQTAEAWQTDWEKFLDELAPYFQRGDGTVSIIRRFENSEVNWEGTFIGISGTSNNLVDVRMNPRNMFCCGSGGSSYPIAFRVSMEQLDVTPWRAVTPGTRVRFRTRWYLFIPTSTALREFIVVARGGELAPTPPPVPTVLRVVNGASFGSEISSRSWITIQGSNLAGTSRTWQSADFQGNRLPTSLDGVSVRVNNQDAPVYFISPGQINALAPSDSTVGPVSVTVTNPAGTSTPFSATLQRYAPAFFMFDVDNRRYVAAVHTDGTFVGRPGLFGSSIASRPAKPGDRVLLFGTGFGPTNPEVPTNEVFSGAAPLADLSQFSVQVGRTQARVDFVGLVGLGLYQINLVIPEGVAAGDAALTAELSGQRTQSAFLALQGSGSGPPFTVTPTSLRFEYSDLLPPIQTLQVTSIGEPIDFTVTKTMPWAFVEPAVGKTPAALRVSTSTFLPLEFAKAGTYSGTITLQPAGGQSPLLVPVTLVVIVRTPSITSVTPQSLLPGEARDITFTGANMRSVHTVEFLPAAGITVQNIRKTDSTVTAFVAVQSNATLGTRQVALIGLGLESRSSPVAFSIAAPPPPASPPTISNATGTSVQSGPAGPGGTVSNTFTLDFQDSDADVVFTGVAQSSAKVRIELIFPNLRFTCFEELTGAFLHKPGERSGRISHTYSFTRGGSNPSVVSTDGSPTIPVSFTLFDAAGRASNTITARTVRWTLNCQ